MATIRRKFTREFKVHVVRELEAGKSVAEVSREHQVHPTQLDPWWRALRRYGERAFAGNGRAYSDEARMAALERKIGQLTMDNDLLKKALSALETRDPVQSGVKKNDERAGPQTGRSIRRRADHGVVWSGGFDALDVLPVARAWRQTG